MKKIIALMIFVGVFGVGYSQSYYYNDYRRSINDVNWQTMVADLILSPQQKDQLFALNNRYPSYDTWVVVYKDRPDRWRTDRYYEIERILGPVKYKKFKNKYYKGRNPVAVYNRNKNNDKRYKKMQKEYQKQWKHSGKGHKGKGKGHHK